MRPLDFDTDVIQLAPRSPALLFWYAYSDMLDALERTHHQEQADYLREATPARLVRVTDWQTIDSKGVAHPLTPADYIKLVARDLTTRQKAHKAHRATLTDSITRVSNARATTPRHGIPALEACAEIIADRLTTHDAEAKKLAWQIATLTSDPQKPTDTFPHAVSDADIARARDFPIAEILAAVGVSLTRTHAARLTTRCPLGTHTEKTPSFTVYVNQNTAYCYSCTTSCDSIALYMKLHQCTFVVAVRALTCG